MKSVSDPAVLDELLERIEKLQPYTQRLWGQMDVAQMMAHCSTAMEVALGDIEAPRSMVGTLIGGLVKNIYTSERPFKKNSPTDPMFIVADQKLFHDEKVRIVMMLKRLSAGGPELIHNRKHPFFGRLTYHEWNTTQYKHLDHHLRQFGV